MTEPQASIAKGNSELRTLPEYEALLANERAARVAAEEACRLKDELLATLAHDLRTPLNTIVGWAQILRTGKASRQDLDEGLEVIERSARDQARMIADLQNRSCRPAGQPPMNSASFDPASPAKLS